MPRQLSEGREFDTGTIVGHVFAWRIPKDRGIANGGPWLVRIEGKEYVPVFPNPEALAEAMKWIGVTEYLVMPIQNAHDFLATCAATDVKAVINLRKEENERLRWTELRYPWDGASANG